jgi:hypothetical protein
VTVVAIDLTGLHAGLGRHVDGILGYDIFCRYVVEIDYAATNYVCSRRTSSTIPPRTKP